MKLVTAAQMRALEERAVERGTPLDALMEQAGLALAQEAWLLLGVVAGRRVLVLAGPGNNGGDGMVAARHLAEWEADVAVYAPVERGTGRLEAALQATGVRVVTNDSAWLEDALGRAELVIDALLGIGRGREIEGALAHTLDALRGARASSTPPKLIAADIPSGVDADSGAADARAVAADMTVTFGYPKVGLYTLPGAEYAGQVQPVDIGLAAAADDNLPIELLSTSSVRGHLAPRALSGNKGTFGRVLVVAGSPRYPGAARLAAEGCYRAGAGLVTLACASQVRATVAAALPEAVYAPLSGEGTLSPADMPAINAAFASHDVLLVGPGLSQEAGVGDAVTTLLRAAPNTLRGCVVDADALNAVAHDVSTLRDVAAACVLTPHPGEMARLLGVDVASVQRSRLACAQEAANTWGHVVVLKGAHTVVAAPDGRAAISPYANPLLATAGTGDVLAGVIAGMLAQGMCPFEAASCAMYVHAFAAEELRDELGDRGMLASELLQGIPQAVRTIREGRKLPPMPLPPALGGFGGLGAPG